MPNHLPWFPFYATDWLADARVRALTFEERGMYIDLLAWQWREGALRDGADVRSAEDHLLAQLGVAPGDPRAERVMCVLDAFFPVDQSDAIRRNPRLDHIRIEQEAAYLAQSSAGKRGRAKQLHKGRGAPGNPRAKPRPAPGEAREIQNQNQIQSHNLKTTPSAPAARGKDWLTPFSEAWSAAYGGEPPFGQLASYLKKLLQGHPHGIVLDYWQRYLAATEARYASPTRFAQTFGSWAKPERSHEDHLPDMYLTLEEQEARRKRLAGAPPSGAEHVGSIVGRVMKGTQP